MSLVRAETIIEAARAAYLRRGFGGSWTQPSGQLGYEGRVRKAARRAQKLLFLPCPSLSLAGRGVLTLSLATSSISRIQQIKLIPLLYALAEHRKL